MPSDPPSTKNSTCQIQPYNHKQHSYSHIPLHRRSELLLMFVASFHSSVKRRPVSPSALTGPRLQSVFDQMGMKWQEAQWGCRTSLMSPRWKKLTESQRRGRTSCLHVSFGGNVVQPRSSFPSRLLSFFLVFFFFESLLLTFPSLFLCALPSFTLSLSLFFLFILISSFDPSIFPPFLASVFSSSHPSCRLYTECWKQHFYFSSCTSPAVKAEVFPLLDVQCVKFCRDRQVSSVKSKIWLDYKVTPHISMWISQSRSRRLSGEFTGTLMDDVSLHDLGRHPALGANGLHISALKMNISICGWYHHRHVRRRLNAPQCLLESKSQMIWEDVSALLHFLLFSFILQTELTSSSSSLWFASSVYVSLFLWIYLLGILH